MTIPPEKIISYDDLINSRKLNEIVFKREIQKIINYKPNENVLCYVGNKILYHYQFHQLLKSYRKGKKSLYNIFQSEADLLQLYHCTIQRRGIGFLERPNIASELFEVWRINSGAIAFFKMCTASFLYKKYNATKVLDMTAGWGGRALGAINLNLEYTGFDTNIELKSGYDAMLENFPNHKINMIYQDCLSYDFEKLDYDFMLSSPPYEDLEIYEHLKTYSRDNFYTEFLIPYINKARKYNKGFTAVNISPQMYRRLTCIYKYEKCLHTELLKEAKNGRPSDLIYFWK